MKVLYVILIAILLAGCGPTTEQMTATAVMAQAQTQTAAPTATPTPTLTPTPTQTATPTSTPIPTPISSESIVAIPHAAPEEEIPSGLPDRATSRYLKTTSGGFMAQLGVEGKPSTARFNISLEMLENIPDQARIEIHFENPLDATTAIVTQLDGPYSNSILVMSPSMQGLECKTYWVEIHIYSDSSKTTELGSHLQWLKSDFDTEKMKGFEDLLGGTSCKR